MGMQADRAVEREDDISLRMRDARLRLIARSGLASGPLNVLNSGLLAVFLAGGVNPWILGAWLAAVVVVSAARMVVLLPARKPGRALSRRMMAMFIVLSCAMGALWGAAP